MRVVKEKGELQSALTSAQREALSSFGDSSMLLEKYFENVKHIEVQIIGDQHGNVSHIFERECTVQRRHQKIIEEAPSSCLSNEIREKILNAAVEIGQIISYQSVGTVEFIYEPSTKEFYFLEVNTRLQVEHPVTEMITNLDLVLLQIKIAEGYSLSELNITSNKLKINGHAIECRLCAEDPNNDFFPCTGPIQLWMTPKLPNIRFDTGIYTGGEISVFYDPMIAKIIAWAPTRENAIQLMKSALQKLIVLGLPTNLEFLIQILSHNSFLDSTFNTHFIENYFQPNVRELNFSKKFQLFQNEICIFAMLFDWDRIQRNRNIQKSVLSGWRNNRYKKQSKFFLLPNEEIIEVKYIFNKNYNSNSFYFNVFIGDIEFKEIEILHHIAGEPNWLVRILEKVISFEAVADSRSSDLIYLHSNEWGNVTVQKKDPLLVKDDAEEEIDGNIISPMPARILEIYVKDGDTVKAGQPILVVESMKMQNTYNAACDGIVKLFVQENQLIEAGAAMASIEPKS